MILPDAEGFIVAAQKLLGGMEVVYLHDAEGAIVAVLLGPKPQELMVELAESGRMPNHDHIEPEMGTEVPWMKEGT